MYFWIKLYFLYSEKVSKHNHECTDKIQFPVLLSLYILLLNWIQEKQENTNEHQTNMPCHRTAVPNLGPAGIFLPAKAFSNARGVLFGTKLIG